MSTVYLNPRSCNNDGCLRFFLIRYINHILNIIILVVLEINKFTLMGLK